MRKGRSLVWTITGLLAIAAMLLASCAPQPTAQPTQPPKATEAPASTQAPEATAAPTDVPIVGENYSPDIPDPTEPVTVTWATWVNTDTPFWKQTIEAFNKIHPNIKIEIQSVP